MFGFIAGRIARAVVLLPIVSFLAFGLILIVPGDPAATLAGENPSREQIAEYRRQLNLDAPVLYQYGHWARRALSGDLGVSLQSGRSVSYLIWDRLPVTLSLVFSSVLVGLLLSVPFGILAAVRRNKLADRLVTAGATLGVAVPSFVLGMVLLAYFAISTKLLPATGYVGPTKSIGDWLSHIALPALTLGVAVAAELTRHLRGALSEVLTTDYIRTAKAKGVAPSAVIGKHALKNAAIPVVTVLGAQVAVLLGGTVIVEQLFALPGIGSLVIMAVTSHDIPIIQGVVLLTGVMVLLVNTAVDISYGYFDPRVRTS